MTYEGIDAAGFEFIFLLLFWGGLILWGLTSLMERFNDEKDY